MKNLEIHGIRPTIILLTIAFAMKVRPTFSDPVWSDLNPV